MKQNKIKNLLLTMLALLLGVPALAQVGIGTDNPKGVLDVKDSMGIVLPRVQSVDSVRTPDGGEPILGTMVFDTSKDKNCARVKTSEGWSNCLLDQEGKDSLIANYLGLGANVLAAKVAISNNWSMILGSDHSLYFSGNNTNGVSGLGRASGAVISYTIALAYPIVDVGAGLTHAIAADAYGRVWTWGANANFRTGQINPTTNTYISGSYTALPDSCDFFGPVKGAGFLAKQVDASSTASFVVTDNGDLYSVGAAVANGTPTASTTTLGWTRILTNVVQVSASLNATGGAVTRDGKVYVWGANGSYIGTGITSGNAATPTALTIPGNTPIKKVAMGYRCGAAVSQDGTKVYAWGVRYAVANPAANVLSPIDITSYIPGFDASKGDRILDVSVGRYTSGGNIVVVTNKPPVNGLGGVYTAGENSYGQLGIATNTDQRGATLMPINWLRINNNTQIVGAASGDRNTVLLTVTGEGDTQQPGIAYGAGRIATYRVLGALNGNLTYFTAMTQ